jgi:hypothetical protein
MWPLENAAMLMASGRSVILGHGESAQSYGNISRKFARSAASAALQPLWHCVELCHQAALCSLQI